MVVLVGPFRPGHSGVDEDEPVTSLDEESVVRKRNLLVRDVLQVGLRREVEMGLFAVEGVGGVGASLAG